MTNTILTFQNNNLLPELSKTNRNPTLLDDKLKLPGYSDLEPNDYTNFSNDTLNSNKLIAPVLLFDQVGKDELPDSIQVPTFAEVKKGAVLSLGQKGPSIKELQNRLSKLGFSIKDTGEFGKTTEEVLKQFQKRFGIAQTGKFGPSSLTALETAEKSKALGKTLAESAKKVARKRNTYGQCYNAVAESIDKKFGDFLRGDSAYMAANQLAGSAKFKELKVKNTELPDLPAGAVVVWGKTRLSPDGHISVALGNGQEASDYITDQLTNLRGYNNFRVFIPVKA